MNGRLYDPVVGRFLSPDPYIQDPGFTQNLNRYSYCLNNPLKYTDPTGNKWNWNWLNPLYWFSEGMQVINDNTTRLRQNMANAGIPPFGVGVNVNLEGNVNANGSVYGRELFNTANIDRSNADEVVNKAINNARQIGREASNGVAMRDATRVSINLLESGIIKKGATDGIWGIGDIIEVGGAIKPNSVTPIIGLGITLYNAGDQINNGDYVEATWTIIEGAGGIYSVGAKGLYQLSQTQYMQQGVNQIFRQEYMRNQYLYETTGDYGYRVRAMHYNDLMKY